MIYEVLREEEEKMVYYTVDDTEIKTAVNDGKHPFACIMASGVQSEEDLKPRSKICINPPPSDGQCECCGKHISQLKPFGKAGDPCAGDFDGAYLVKGWRWDDPSCNCVGASWECRDCILLDDNEYFEMLAKRFSEKKKTN